MVLPSAWTYRLRGCPASVTQATLRNRLAQAFGDVAENEIHIQSLANTLHPWGSLPTKTATLRFARLPTLLSTPPGETEWIIQGHGLDGALILDTHFLGLTPLNEINAEQHHFE